MVGACGDNDQWFPTNTSKDPTNLNEWVRLKDKFTMSAFGTLIIHEPTEEMMMGENLCIITQALYPEDGAILPKGLYVLGVYAELKDGSRIEKK